MSHLWFAKHNETYQGKEQAVYAISEIDICISLETEYARTVKELETVLKNDGVFRSFSDNNLQSPSNSWTKLVLLVWGIENPNVMVQFPSLERLITQNPDITSVFISRLAPKAFIKAHSGETNGIYRVHLGLKIPDENLRKSGIRVCNENHHWREGKTFVFLDAHRHEAWNDAEEDRFIVIVDLVRPEFRKYRDRICVRILLNQLIFNLFDRTNNKQLLKAIGKLPPLLVYPTLLFFHPIKWLQSKLNLVSI